MYKPAPSRQKKTNICRSRTGCKNCKVRRKKCDEKWPCCGSCKKLGVPCEPILPKWEFVSVSCRPRGIEESAESTFSIGTTIETLKRPNAPTFGHSTLNYTTNPDTPSSNGYSDNLAIFWQSEQSFSPNNSEESVLESARSISLPQDLCVNVNTETHSSSPFYADEEVSYAQSNTFSGQTSNLPKGNIDANVTMPLVLAPRHDLERAVGFYLNEWKQHCLPTIHWSFQYVNALSAKQSFLTDAMATLSACRLSRALPQKKLFTVNEDPGLRYRPDASHECLSGALYCSAMRKVARWSRQEVDLHPLVVLAVMVLFCYLESSMGNFREFRMHSGAVEKLVESYPSDIIPRGTGLLAAWVEVKMQNWWRRAHFSTPDAFRAQGSPMIPFEIQGLLNSSKTRRATISWILCESHRAHLASLIAHGDAHSNLADFRETLSQVQCGVDLPIHSKELEFQLTSSILSTKLDAWLATSAVDELPQYTGDELPGTTDDRTELPIQAISFASHASAMNYAYYVTARVIQSTLSNPLWETNTPVMKRNFAKDGTEVEFWVQILLGIASSIDWKNCISFNVYTIAFSGLLLDSAVCSRSLTTGLWIQRWLEQHLDGQEFEEGNFPVYQILSALRLVNRLRQAGEDALALFQTVIDEGGTGKFGSYHSQRIKSLLVYGQSRATGMLSAHVEPV